MSFASEVQDALTEAEGRLEVTFIYDTTQYPAIASNERRSMNSGFGGLEVEDVLTLIVRPNALGVANPKPREKITYNGRPYSIESIERAPQNAFVKLHLESANG
jgi:hypothetical protein